MAGQPGYYLVILDNHTAGIVQVPANQKPQSVAGHSVLTMSYLGASTKDILANWDAAIRQTGAVGLYELGPPGSESAIIGGGTDLGTLIKQAETRGSAILTHTPSSAEWDPAFTILAGGLGAVVSGAVRAAAAGADAASTGGTTAGTTATSGAVSGATSAAAKALAGAGLTGLLGVTDSWQQLAIRVLEGLAGIALLLLGLQALTGQGAQGNPIKAAKGLA